MNYNGVDCHIATMDFAVVNEKGQVSKKVHVNTGERTYRISRKRSYTGPLK